jgi:hypothetical protein
VLNSIQRPIVVDEQNRCHRRRTNTRLWHPTKSVRPGGIDISHGAGHVGAQDISTLRVQQREQARFVMTQCVPSSFEVCNELQNALYYGKHYEQNADGQRKDDDEEQPGVQQFMGEQQHDRRSRGLIYARSASDTPPTPCNAQSKQT